MKEVRSSLSSHKFKEVLECQDYCEEAVIQYIEDFKSRLLASHCVEELLQQFFEGSEPALDISRLQSEKIFQTRMPSIRFREWPFAHQVAALYLSVLDTIIGRLGSVRPLIDKRPDMTGVITPQIMSRAIKALGLGLRPKNCENILAAAWAYTYE